MHRLILIVVAWLFSINAWSGDRELFKSVPEAKSAKLEAYNQPDFSMLTYSAKRYRIVRVDSKLLTEQDGGFVLNLFDDVRIEVVTEAVDGHDPDGMIVWRGRIKNWERVVDTISQMSAGEKKHVEDQNLVDVLTSITLYAHSWDVDKDTGEAIPATQRKVGFVSERPLADAKLPNLKKNVFRSVFGRFTHLGQKTYVLKRLKFTPKYHVIVEVDEEKSIGGIDTPASERTPESREKARRYTEFYNSLPLEEPGKEVKEDLDR